MRRIGPMVALAVTVLTIAGSDGRAIAASQSALSAPRSPAAGQGKLIVYGDLAIFLGPGKEGNCTLKNRYKRGDPVGFRMFVADPSTGLREESAQLVVHLTYAGKTENIPMRYRATAAQPERQFWVAKWVVPETTPVGIIRFSVTATDKYGRTGEYKPFEVEASQLTIVE